MDQSLVLIPTSVTREGLHHFLCAAYYTRIRIAQNFLPNLVAASQEGSLARVVDVAGGTKEGEVDVDDLAAMRLPFSRIRGHLTSMHTLSLETLAEQAPSVSFVHDFPGSVATPLADDVPGAVGYLIRAAGFVMKYLLGRWVCVPIDECGERHVFLGTSAKFAPKQGTATGVPLLADMEVGRGSDGAAGSGVYAVDWDCDSRDKPEQVLKGLRKKGVSEVIWKHNMEQFERISTEA